MSFIGDFFRSLANNPNVTNDEEIHAELNQFLRDNSESSKRIAFLEHNIVKNDDNKEDKYLDKKELSKAAKEVIRKYKPNGAGSSNKVERGIEEKEASREIGE